MKNRIENKFQELKKNKAKAFIAFITAGFPNLSATEKLIYALDSAGADIIELGVPFSDPLADGPTIQSASYLALKNGTNLKKIFEVVKKARAKTEVPIALMTYYNPVFHYGEELFIRDCVKCGVDGVIIPDLPPEEATTLISLARKNNIATVFFVSPTTSVKRMRFAAQKATGFIYYVSTTGVTGERRNLAKNIFDNVRKIKQLTHKPVCVGFGISNSSQAKEILKVADGVIVGSAIIKKIAENKTCPNLNEKVKKFVFTFKKEIK